MPGFSRSIQKLVYFFAILLDHPDKPGNDIKVDEKGACRNANERNAIGKIGASAPLSILLSKCSHYKKLILDKYPDLF